SAKPGDSTIKPRIPFIRRRFTSITSPSLPANLFPRQTPPHTQNVLVLLLRHQPARRPAGHGAPRVPPTNASTAPPHAPAPPASPGRLDRRRLRRAASRLFLPLVRPAHPHELGRGLRAGRPQLQLHAAAPGGARRVARRQAPRRRSQAQLLCRCRLVAGCWLGRCGCSPCCSGLEEEQLSWNDGIMVRESLSGITNGLEFGNGRRKRHVRRGNTVFLHKSNHFEHMSRPW
ncbi:hypothetical protein IWX49DRAFT_637336, partial [Phyllosticta citricarpa]